MFPKFEWRVGINLPSHTNGEKDRFVCRPSRIDDIHDGFDRKMQAVKMADVWGIEKYGGVFTKAAQRMATSKHEGVALLEVP